MWSVAKKNLDLEKTGNKLTISCTWIIEEG
jgi:hypothetical protein